MAQATMNEGPSSRAPKLLSASRTLWVTPPSAALYEKSLLEPSFGSGEILLAAISRLLSSTSAALGDEPRPILGWLMVAGDDKASRRRVRTSEPHFKVFPDWRDVSFIQSYDQLCQRLVKEGLYGAAALLAAPLNAAETGEYAEFSALCGLECFVTTFAAHIAAEASRPLPTPGGVIYAGCLACDAIALNEQPCSSVFRACTIASA